MKQDMSDSFFSLQPDVKVLKRYGYRLFPQERQLLKNRNPLNVEIYMHLTPQRRRELDLKINKLFKDALNVETDDTLLYIIIQEANSFFEMLDLELESRDYRHKTIDIAKILADIGNAMQVSEIKIISQGKTITINHKGIVATMLASLDIYRNEAQHSTFALSGDDDIIPLLVRKSYHELKLKKRKPSKAASTLHAQFMIKILNYVETQKLLSAGTSVLYSKEQLMFLYNLSKTFQIIPPNKMHVEPKEFVRKRLDKLRKPQ